VGGNIGNRRGAQRKRKTGKGLLQEVVDRSDRKPSKKGKNKMSSIEWGKNAAGVRSHKKREVKGRGSREGENSYHLMKGWGSQEKDING